MKELSFLVVGLVFGAIFTKKTMDNKSLELDLVRERARTTK
jgi:hypothetical protein